MIRSVSRVRSVPRHNKKIQSTEDKVFDFVVNVLIILATVITLYPMYFVVLSSISSPSALLTGQSLLVPVDISFASYKYIFADTRIWRGYGNTIFYTFFNTLLGTAMTVLAGYALSRKDLVGRNIFMKLMVFTMYFQGGLVPTYMVVRDLHLINTRAVMIILGAFTVFNLIIVRTFFVAKIPDELLEAAQLDGCGNGRFFFSIVLPLSKEIVAVVVLYIAVASWNSFFNALIYLSSQKLYPLQLILREILLSGQTIQNDVDAADIAEMQRLAATIKYAVMVISTLPILALYPFVQKYFVKGVMVGSVKG